MPFSRSELGEYTIPAGTTCLISSYVLHRDPKVFPKPEQFNPDNFLQENCHGRNPFAYIPFSAGPRNCKSLTSYFVVTHVCINPMNKLGFCPQVSAKSLHCSKRSQ